MKHILIIGAVMLCALGIHPLRGQNLPDEATSSKSKTPSVLVTKSYPAKKAKMLLVPGFRDVLTSLESSGVIFPAGSFARWKRNPKHLIVCNTQENLDLIDALLVPPPTSLEGMTAARRIYTASPPKLSLTQASALVRHSHQRMLADYRRAVFPSSTRLVFVSDLELGQPTSIPFWEIKYSWNYRPDDEAEIYYVTMEGKVTSLIKRH